MGFDWSSENREPLIISHKHKFIFLKTHKTGGTSMQIALSRHCGDDDIISRIHEGDKQELIKAGGRDQQNWKVPFSRYNSRDWFQYLLRGRKQYFAEHLDAKNIIGWIGEDVWNAYYKFCFERNPYDKVLSYYYWRTRDMECTLDEFLDAELDSLSDFKIYSIENELKVDNVFLYEDLENNIEFLERKFQFKMGLNKIRAKSTHRPQPQSYDEVLTSAQKVRIAKVFKKEIDLFYPELSKNL